MMLPYLEQSVIYNSINFQVPGGSAPGTPANSTAQRTGLSAFARPSDTDRLASPEGHNSYFGNTGVDPDMNDGKTFGLLGGMYESSPVFSLPVLVRLQDISGGPSNTAAFAERVKGIGLNNDAQTPDNMNPPGSALRLDAMPNDAEVVYSRC